MFERNKIDSQAEKGTLAARITLDDDRVLTGKFVIPINKSIFDILNSSGGFVEFETFEGEREFLSKHTLRAVKLLTVPRGESLDSRVRSLDGFDPYRVLGVTKGSDWDSIRAAYIRLARDYHPDRYSTIPLPDEISNYLEGMSQRINAAYGALELQRDSIVKTRKPLAEPVFTSSPRS